MSVTALSDTQPISPGAGPGRNPWNALAVGARADDCLAGPADRVRIAERWPRDGGDDGSPGTVRSAESNFAQDLVRLFRGRRRLEVEPRCERALQPLVSGNSLAALLERQLALHQSLAAYLARNKARDLRGRQAASLFGLARASLTFA
jgi:hypothetical protein